MASGTGPLPGTVLVLASDEARLRHACRALPALLKPAEKRALDLLADWPWIFQKDLADLLGVSETRISRTVAPLEGLGLATRSPAAGNRLALPIRGWPSWPEGTAPRWAWRGSVGASRSWMPTLPSTGAMSPGGRSRHLLRNLEHTAAVHGCMAALARQCRALGWEMVQFDPPHRASRHFRHEGALRSVYPDAFGLLRRGPVSWGLLPGVGAPRRPARHHVPAPGPLPALLLPHGPTDDHGIRPVVLVVFDDDIAATHFLTLAEKETARAGVNVPLWVSHREAVHALGPLGRAWLTPGDWEPARLLPRNKARMNRLRMGSIRRIPFPSDREEKPCARTYQLQEWPRRRRGRTVVRLDTAALWERLALLGRSQNWLAREIGVSPGYVSMLVNEGRAPSGRIRTRMLKALGVDDFHQLFTLEVLDDDP